MRKAEIDINDEKAWHLCNVIFNELFNAGDIHQKTGSNIQYVKLNGVTPKGMSILKEYEDYYSYDFNEMMK